MARRLPAYIFWNVANGHVNGVGRFVVEKCKLGLVRGDDNGNNCVAPGRLASRPF